MRNITQEEFDNLPIVNGFKECPSNTDYSNIKNFGNYCIFGNYCRFGNGCIFGNYCIFGINCIFGNYCRFGSDCRFGNYCTFGNDCIFGNYCRFGNDCTFADYFAFGNDCSFEGHKSVGTYPYIYVSGLGSRIGSTTYFFNFEEGIHVRCGCFFGTIKEFKSRCKKEGKTIYLDFCKIAVKQIKEFNK